MFFTGAVALDQGRFGWDDYERLGDAAVDALAEIGTRDALPALESCARRFADTPFLPFAISIAVAHISTAKV